MRRLRSLTARPIDGLSLHVELAKTSFQVGRCAGDALLHLRSGFLHELPLSVEVTDPAFECSGRVSRPVLEICNDMLGSAEQLIPFCQTRQPRLQCRQQLGGLVRCQQSLIDGLLPSVELAKTSFQVGRCAGGALLHLRSGFLHELPLGVEVTDPAFECSGRVSRPVLEICNELLRPAKQLIPFCQPRQPRLQCRQQVGGLVRCQQSLIDGLLPSVERIRADSHLASEAPPRSEPVVYRRWKVANGIKGARWGLVRSRRFDAMLLVPVMPAVRFGKKQRKRVDAA